MNAVAVPRAAQGVPKNTLTWKNKLYIIIKIFYICSILETPSITKLGTPSNYIKKKNCNRAKPTAIPTDYKGSKPMDSQKNKKNKTKQNKKQKKQKQKNRSEKTNPNTKQITKSKITYESEITSKSEITKKS